MVNLDERAALACSLNDADYRERRAMVRKTFRQNITTLQRTTNGLILKFIQTDNLRSEIEAFIGQEKRCCGFLNFTIRPAADHAKAALELHIEGPPDAAATIEMFARAIEEQI
jgi:hypothetical protein